MKGSRGRRVAIWAAALALCAALGAGAGEASARTTGHAGPGGPFGAGLSLGAPTGLSAEYYLDRANALHAAIGLDLFEGQEFALHLNWRGYLFAIADARRVRLPFYIGLGGFLGDRDLDEAGLRAPAGFAVDFRAAPVQLFFELAGKLPLTGGDALSPSAAVAFGLHVYF